MTSVLLLVDVQRNMLHDPEPVPDAETVGPVIENLLTRAREAGAVVVHIRNNGDEHDPDVPGSAGWELVHDVHDVRGAHATYDGSTPATQTSRRVEEELGAAGVDVMKPADVTFV
jgi:nicotinamidase-related amidase